MSKKNPAVIAENIPWIYFCDPSKKTTTKYKIKIEFSVAPIILKCTRKLVCNIPSRQNNKNIINNLSHIYFSIL